MKWYKQISNNCKKATFLIDKKKLEGISLVQLAELKLHLAGCSICRLYQKQSQAVDQLVDAFYKTHSTTEVALDEGFKEVLEQNILKELKNKLN